MTPPISDKDKKDWQDFILSEEKVTNKDLKVIPKNHEKARSIDLHGYTLDQANKKVIDFITDAYNAKIKKLIIITGKGIHSDVEKDPYVSKDLSILKYSVPEFISNNENLMSMINEIKDARIDDGGSGAFYIFLKNKI